MYIHMYIYIYILYIYIYILYSMCVKKCPACYLGITGHIEYVGYLYRILIIENTFKCKASFFSILILKFDFDSI